ncbi:PTS galactosamine/N-acetylgalactosamine transporter subunit IIA [Klebsiella sp. BIGb0407]|uniref:PTS galactosamine/N-acetylgalactosamine transporter subunit IIA n=1 Tax=Klebsiella sp. BIGb0407 TaxID=2940603 RepID=UPI00216A9491|nr:PTS galactosamine/N-acetylgalactosamine transporter subunit IIA [Klebsiella sp. BIGb0407]MCS3430932.1 PTS system N-acetylgalactosamine-specific IIA component [Klebsiella sp. BIGb0407]
MISIILSGHGGFATGLEKAMRQIVGDQPQVIAIDFTESTSPAQLNAQFERALVDLDEREGLIFLTDLLGGTPFRLASILALEKTNREVITGVNLQLLLEMVLDREVLNSEEFRQKALECGHRGLTSLVDEMERYHMHTPDEDEI